MNMESTTVRSFSDRRNLSRKPIALAIAASLIGVASLTGCSPSAPNADVSTPTVAKSSDANVQIAPGAPGKAPTWAFSGKTGIGTS